MTDVRKLLAAATPLPWDQIGQTIVKGLHSVARAESDGGDFVNGLLTDDQMEAEELADAALIVYAVNRLPDYLAAVEALEQTTTWMTQECWPEADYVGQGHNWSMSEDEREMGIKLLVQARAALVRLRDEVPA